MKPHKHHDTIVAWAAGNKVQYREDGVNWIDISSPIWDVPEHIEYRVKPAEPERRYPVTVMSLQELENAWGVRSSGINTALVRDAINAGLRHACDNGQSKAGRHEDIPAAHRGMPEGV